MGTWSRPLFAVVSPGKPEDWFIDFKEWPIQRMQRWGHAAFFPDMSVTRINLATFMNTECDTHRILDHMDQEQINRWIQLFRDIYAGNPTLNSVEFHFFCTDTQEPFFLKVSRDRPTRLELGIGQSESIWYFHQKRRLWGGRINSGDEERLLIFDEKAYRAALSKCRFRYLNLIESP